MLAGVLVLTWHHPSVPAPVVTTGHGDVCLALLVVRDALLMDRPPPPFATDVQILAAVEMNTHLAQVRARLFDVDGIRQLGCPGGG